MLQKRKEECSSVGLRVSATAPQQERGWDAWMTERDREPREPGGAGEITTIMEGLLFLLLIFTLYEYFIE